MEAVVILILIIGLLIINKNINSKFKNLESTINSLRDTITSLQAKLAKQSNVLKDKEETIYQKETPRETSFTQPEMIEEVPIITPEETTDVTIEKTIAESIKPITEKEFSTTNAIQEEEITKQTEEVPKESEEYEEQIYTPKKPWLDRFKEQNPDLEKFIGENLINKIGILILVLGISFFVKYAIDKDWINEPARVGIGILSGALVMAIAHKLKKNYAAFSSVLVAGAISIFYFTIYIAFHEYQLFSQTIAFSIMALITAFSALVSISYNRQELAVLSLIGGFAAPFMLSTGQGNYVVLFSYITILNIGILTLSYFKKWKVVTILAFVFTVLLFGVWCLVEIGSKDFSHSGALTFATIFYFIFSITIVLNNLRNKGVFSKIEYVILVTNTFFFFGIGLNILNDLNTNYTGLFTLMLSIYNIIYAAILFKKFGLDKNAVYLLIGLALTFVTLTIPIQFEGNQITIFWALEAILLFWFSQKSKLNSFKLGAIIVQVLTIFSLLFDWEQYMYADDLSVFINPLFITGFVVSISLFVTYWLLRKEKSMTTKFFSINIKLYQTILLITALIISYFTGALEVDYQANQFLANNYSAKSFCVTYHYVFVSIILLLASVFKKEIILKGILVISVISTATYILLFYNLPTLEIIQNFTLKTNTKFAFYFHYIILGCLIYFGYHLFKKTKTLFHIQPKKSKWMPWVFAFAIVYILSNEVMIHGLQFNSNLSNTSLTQNFTGSENETYQKNNFINLKIEAVKTQIIKIGYPIVWGIFSFVFLIIGIKKQWKVLRIIALSLLGLTIIKLFAYDIKNVSETGKIIAFILLGVLILIISFVYQKIKKLVVDETLENEHTDEKI